MESLRVETPVVLGHRAGVLIGGTAGAASREGWLACRPLKGGA